MGFFIGETRFKAKVRKGTEGKNFSTDFRTIAWTQGLKEGCDPDKVSVLGFLWCLLLNVVAGANERGHAQES